MTNTILTPEQIQVLRIGVGLVNGATKPTRDNFPRSCERGRENIIESLIDMELMTRRKIFGMGGVELYLVVTDEGRRVAMEAVEAAKVSALMRE